MVVFNHASLCSATLLKPTLKVHCSGVTYSIQETRRQVLQEDSLVLLGNRIVESDLLSLQWIRPMSNCCYLLRFSGSPPYLSRGDLPSFQQHCTTDRSLNALKQTVSSKLVHEILRDLCNAIPQSADHLVSVVPVMKVDHSEQSTHSSNG